MNNGKNVPEVRFDGFSGGWDSKEFRELAEIVRGASPRPIDDPKWFDKNSKVGWLRIRDVTKQDGRIHHLQQRISKEGEDKTRVLHEPHLLLSIAASVGKPVINYVSTGVHDGFLIFRKPNFDMEFMYQWLKSFELRWQQYGQPGSQVNLNSDIVKDQMVLVPGRDEQVVVGNYFQKLDTLINQHQQKHDKLSNLKKAMLQKMFPKAGEPVPEIRFDGFSGDWEEKELHEISTYRNGKAHEQAIDPNGEFIVVNSKFVATNGTVKKYSILQISPMKANEIAFVLSDVPNGKAIARTFLINSDDLYTLNQRIAGITPSECTHYYFLHITLNRNTYFLKFDDGVKQTNLSVSDVEQFKSRYPKLEEQTKIGNYFQNLDVLINLHNQQITKLKNIKQACLDKMFV